MGGADKGHFLASSGQWEELCPVVFILHYKLMLHCPHSAKKDLSINVISFITTESTNFLFQNLFIDGVGGRKYHTYINVFDMIVHFPFLFYNECVWNFISKNVSEISFDM